MREGQRLGRGGNWEKCIDVIVGGACRGAVRSKSVLFFVFLCFPFFFSENPQLVRGASVLVRASPCKAVSVSYPHLRAHDTLEHPVCRLLLEKKILNAVST